MLNLSGFAISHRCRLLCAFGLIPTGNMTLRSFSRILLVTAECPLDRNVGRHEKSGDQYFTYWMKDHCARLFLCIFQLRQLRVKPSPSRIVLSSSSGGRLVSVHWPQLRRSSAFNSNAMPSMSTPVSRTSARHQCGSSRPRFRSQSGKTLTR